MCLLLFALAITQLMFQGRNSYCNAVHMDTILFAFMYTGTQVSIVTLIINNLLLTNVIIFKIN
jgi:hypothetical protein